MKIAPDNELLQYSGRIDFEVQTAPVFVYAGSFVKIKFRGACISADISNHIKLKHVVRKRQPHDGYR